MKIEDFQRKFELLAEETGMHIGDGSMNFYANNGRNRGLFQLRGHLLDDKEYYEDHVKTLYKELYGMSVSIRTILTPLAEQLMKLMTGLNIRATRYKTIRKNKNWRDVWCINVRGFTEVREFLTKVKPKNPKHLNKFSKLVSSYPPNDEADNRKVAGSNPARPTISEIL